MFVTNTVIHFNLHTFISGLDLDPVFLGSDEFSHRLFAIYGTETTIVKFLAKIIKKHVIFFSTPWRKGLSSCLH